MSHSDPHGAEILVVDDEPVNLALLTAILSAQNYRVRSATRGRHALVVAQESPPDLILLDIRMPGLDGYQVCEQLKSNDKTCDIPIIFVSALDDTQEKVRALAAGAVDYITKPFKEAEILARVGSHLALRAVHKQLELNTARLEQEIAERAEIEESLREKEARFRAITENITHIVMILDQVGRCQYVSPSVSRILGIAPDELLGEPLERWISAEEMPVVKRTFGQAKQEPGNRIGVPDFRVAHSDGRWLFLEGVFVNLLEEPGITGVVFNGYDITERKRVDNELRKVTRAVEQSPSVVVITDTEGNIEYTNPKFTELTGYSFEEVSGENPRILKSGLQPFGDYEHMWRSLAAGEEWRGELSNRKKDGEIYQELASISPIRNAAGETTHFVKVGEDFTARARAEKGLRQRNQELALLNRVGQELASMLDLQDVVDQLLQAATETIGAQDASVWLWDDEDGDDAKDGEDERWLVCRAAFHQGQSHPPINLRLQAGKGVAGWVAEQGKSVVITSVDDDPRFFSGIDEQTGFQTASLIAVPLWVHGSVQGVLEVLNKQAGDFDAHDLVLVETLAASAAIAIDNARLVEALRRQTAELEAQNEELDAFVHTVAHDLKNPLNLIIGYSEVLKEDALTMSRRDLQSRLRRLAQHGYKMNDIVDELLLLAGVRQVEVELGPVDMSSIVSEALDRLELLIEDHEVEIICPDTWPMALGYSLWVEEVWVNYMSNAIKYGGKPPHVVCGADLMLDPVASGDDTERSMVRFWVQDNGLGLTEGEQGRLFTPFTRLEQVRTKGHGLGLSIVRRIVEKLGGSVGVESQVGKGSLFFFTLPAHSDPD